MQPIDPVPVTRYRRTLNGLQLTGGQAQGIVPGSGTVTLQVGPQGLGTVWYPVQATIGTTTGPLDTATALAYVGPLVAPTTLVATVFTGNGTIGNVPAQMAPGQTFIVTWTGATPGDTVALNISGTMDALSTG